MGLLWEVGAAALVYSTFSADHTAHTADVQGWAEELFQ